MFNIINFYRSIISRERIRIHRRLTKKYLHGKGIEIGAQTNPFPVPKNCEVTYVDWIPFEKQPYFLKEKFKKENYYIDVVDDAETLNKFDDSSLDFVIMSQTLEHLPNPIKCIKAVHRVLRKGGIFFISVPNKKLSEYDINQRLTSIEYLENKFLGKVKDLKTEHWLEYIWCVRKKEGIDVIPVLNEFRSIDYRIHFHHFTNWSFLLFLERACVLTNANFEVTEYILDDNWDELIMLMKKSEQTKIPSFREVKKWHDPKMELRIVLYLVVFCLKGLIKRLIKIPHNYLER